MSEKLVQQDSDPWKEDPDYPVSDWQYEVANDDTRAGYLDWVESKRNCDEDQDNYECAECGLGDHPSSECPNKDHDEEQGACILTGAPGENPDDCTTHEHELATGCTTYEHELVTAVSEWICRGLGAKRSVIHG